MFPVTWRNLPWKANSKTKINTSNSWKQKAFKLPRLPSIKLIVPLNFAQKLCKWLIRLDEIIMKNVPQGQIFWKLKQSRLEPEIVVIHFVSRTVLLNFMETNEFICFIEAMKQILCYVEWFSNLNAPSSIYHMDCSSCVGRLNRIFFRTR